MVDPAAAEQLSETSKLPGASILRLEHENAWVDV